MSLSKKYDFISAVPVWESGKENEMNRSLIFRAKLEKGNKKLSIAAHSKYQIFVNGQFFAEGPARAAHGFFRVSEYDLEKSLTMDFNCVCIIVAGYNVNSFYLTDQPPFLCAEISENNEILFATGTDMEFEAISYDNRLRKVQRYSFQRPFTESYMLNYNWDEFFVNPDFTLGEIKLTETKPKCFIERRVPYCRYRELKAKSFVNRGFCVPTVPERKFDDRSLTRISEQLKGFPEKELTRSIANEVYAIASIIKDRTSDDFAPFELSKNGYAVLDMGVDTTGFIKIRIFAEDDIILYCVFNEILPDEGIPDAGAMGCANVVCWELEGGRYYDLISFEPYTYRYIQLISAEGKSAVESVSQLRETYDEELLTNKKSMPDAELTKIYNAAVETFCQNATDIFMDCPSRERAGWLCDSFFTSRVEKELTGHSRVESNFLENFILPKKFDFIPEGMLPMCYPSDHNDGVYIPNWSMWYVLELKEYLHRTGDRELIDAAKGRLTELKKFFEKYENADGLLQKLDSWVFIEWSEANDYVQDVNYPSNMLYSMFLDALYELYGDEELSKKAEKLRQTIREKSFDGTFFTDNAILNENGVAVNTGIHTETAQYYAFFSKTATRETYPELWNLLMTEFGPIRDEKDAHPDVARSNAFVGNYLRLQLMFEAGEYEKLTENIRSFFLPMAQKTGTLWENMNSSASCNHGFASYVLCWLNGMY